MKKNLPPIFLSPFFLSSFLLFSLFSFFVQTATAQETPINRFLKIELGEDDYEILNLTDGVQYSIRTETDENSNLVIRVYDENNQPIAEYPGHAVVYPQFDDEAVLGPNTIIVHQKTNDEDLKNLEDDLIVFRISDSTRNYKVGDILFGGISHESPYGYLRKLISQVENDTLMFFYTEIASLLESFDALSIHRLYDYESLIDEETGETRFEQVGVNGIRTRGMTTLGDLAFGIKAEIKGIDLDFTFKGKVQLEFVFKAKKFLGIPYDVDEFKLVGHFNLDANLVTGYSLNIINFDDKEVGKIPLPNITIPILGVPFVLCNNVVFKVTAEVGVGAELTGGVNGKITAKAGVHYKNKLKGVGEFIPTFQVSPPVSLAVSGYARLKIKPELQVTPYGIGILQGYLNFAHGINFTIQPTSPQWELKRSFEINAGLRLTLLDFLGIKIGAAYNYPFVSDEFVLDSGDFFPDRPSVTTLATSGITASQVTLRGEVTKPGWLPVTERGFEWGLYSTSLTNIEPAGSGVGIFEKQITGLQENITYSYRAYAKNGRGTTFGAISNFAVPVLAPQVSNPYNVCASSMMVNADFTRNSSAGTTIPDEYGFVWTTNSFPTVSGLDTFSNKKSVPVEEDIFSATIGGLDSNTQYRVASYIKYLGKTKISDDETIKTLANENQCVFLDISNPTDVTATSATFHVTVTGNAPVMDKGICYSSDNKVPTIEDIKISKGSGTVDFTVILDDLKEATRYYVCPYAVSDERIFYGAIKEKTPCTPEYYHTSYRDESGILLWTCVNRITTPPLQPLTSGWYSLSNEQVFEFDGTIAIEGDVHLILEDECDWTIKNGGIRVGWWGSLTIYAQNEGTGELSATGSNGSSSSGGASGIGGGGDIYDTYGGNITINGGLIKAKGGNGNGQTGGGAGIGGGGSLYSWYPSGGGGGGIVTINGGIIEATGGNGGNGGQGTCEILILFGTNIPAFGGNGGGGAGAGIGGGGGFGGNGANQDGNTPYDDDGGYGGTITINGGIVTAKGGLNGSGGSGANGCVIQSGYGGGGGGKGACIGGGGGGGSGAGIGGSTSGQAGGSNGPIIGSGSSGGSASNGGPGASGGNGGTVIINGGSVNATGGTGDIMTIRNSNNQNVFRNTLSTPPPPPFLTNAPVTAGMINEIPLSNIPNAAGGVYGIRDVKTDATGRLYFYLPCPPPNGNPRIINVTIDGAVYTATYPCAGNHDDGGNLTE